MARRVEEIARIHLEPRLVRPELEAAPRCRILDPRHQMLVGGHLAADDPIMVVAAAEDDLLVAGVADPLPNRTEEHTPELPPLMPHPYAVFRLQKKTTTT